MYVFRRKTYSFSYICLIIFLVYYYAYILLHAFNPVIDNVHDNIDLVYSDQCLVCGKPMSWIMAPNYLHSQSMALSLQFAIICKEINIRHFCNLLFEI